MDSPKITYKYYSNPAFCAQSEVVYTQQKPCVSPKIVTSPNSRKIEHRRIPPLGANSPRKIFSNQEHNNSFRNQRVKTDISDNPLRNIYSKHNGSFKYATPELPPKPGPKPIQKQTINKIKRHISNRIPFDNKISSKSDYGYHEDLEMGYVNNNEFQEHVEINSLEQSENINRILKHRYAEIPNDFDEYSPSKKRIIESEPEEYNVDQPNEDEYKEIPTEIIRSVNGKLHRYAIIPSDDEDEIVVGLNDINEPNSLPTFHIRSPEMSKKNIEATQKLHEFLSTPKKESRRKIISSPLKSSASSPSLRSQINSQNSKIISADDYVNNVSFTPSKNIASSTPKKILTPSKSCVNIASPPLPRRNTTLSTSPKAQQQLRYDSPYNLTPKKHSSLNYYPNDRSLDNSRDLYEKNYSNDVVKEQLFLARSTAVISPRMISHGSSSIYSDKITKKWQPTPGCASLILVATMLTLCGGLSAALSFYLMYKFGRHYFLDIGVLSGFICLILGLLGCRSHTYQFLPNRNYISGYIMMSVFSLLSCGALLSLLCLGEEWGNGALKGMVGGIVTSLGAICLLLSVIGTVSSYCCGHPPPDNRVGNSRARIV